METPIVIIAFNRPDKVAALLERVILIKPTKIYFVLDGPRVGNLDDVKKCLDVRNIVSDLNWPCSIMINQAPANLGCKERVTSGLDWVFKSESSAIILEDDCIPNQSFFRFCSELLNRYKDETQIGMISGNRFADENPDIETSYSFTKRGQIWGWATWQRAWVARDMELQGWPADANEVLSIERFPDASEQRFWKKSFDHIKTENHQIWDSQWNYTLFKNGWLSIAPKVNLVTNIGFGFDATHTKDPDFKANFLAKEMEFPLTHPNKIEIDKFLDEQELIFFQAPVYSFLLPVFAKCLRFARTMSSLFAPNKVE